MPCQRCRRLKSASANRWLRRIRPPCGVPWPWLASQSPCSAMAVYWPNHARHSRLPLATAVATRGCLTPIAEDHHMPRGLWVEALVACLLLWFVPATSHPLSILNGTVVHVADGDTFFVD